VSGTFGFALTRTDGAARLGRMQTAHGATETPAFMPVGTQGAVKGVTPAELLACGAQIVLSNTYHLALRPGHELIRDLGGLHRFMGWDGPILTDSGGFQVFSLEGLRRIDEDGVTFRSHLDGSTHTLTPESSMAIQTALGSDVAMVLDECPPLPAARETVEAAVGRINIKREEFRRDPRPLDPACACETCRTASRAYLRHLYVSNEILASRYNTIHNLAYYLGLMAKMRDAIAAGAFASFREAFLATR